MSLVRLNAIFSHILLHFLQILQNHKPIKERCQKYVFWVRCITNGRRVIDRWQNTCPCSSCGWDSLLHLAPCWGVSSVSISQDTSSFQHDFCSSAPCPAVPWPCSPYIVSLDTMGNYNSFLITFILFTISDLNCN